MKKIFLFSIFYFLFSNPAFGRIYVPVDQPSEKPFPIAITKIIPQNGSGDLEEKAENISSIIKNDLTMSSYFNIMNESAFLDRSTHTTTETINFSQWTAIEAGAVVKGTIDKIEGKYIVVLKLFDPYIPEMLVGKQYSATKDNLRSAAHRFADEIMDALTGKRGVFNTKITYSASTGRGSKAIYVMDVDGENNMRMTKGSSIEIGPAWSPNGSEIAYSSYQKGAPEIFVVNLGSGKTKQITNNKATNITPAWFPDGKTIYFSSSLWYSTEIFAISSGGGKQRQITDFGGITIAPRFSKDGGTMVYSSTRPGRLHVFRQGVNFGAAARLTFVGVHNDSPDISPDGTKIVFCGQDAAAFDIFVMNSDGTNIQRLTINSGSNEHPRWSPDGRYIIFSSTRSGGPAIYMMRADGANQTRISKGNGSLPDWGPYLK